VNYKKNELRNTVITVTKTLQMDEKCTVDAVIHNIHKTLLNQYVKNLS